MKSERQLVKLIIRNTNGPDVAMVPAKFINRLGVPI